MTQFDLFDHGKMPSDIPFSVDILSVDLAGFNNSSYIDEPIPLKDENLIIKSFPHRATIQKDFIVSENEVIRDISRDLVTISAYSDPDYYYFLSEYSLYMYIMTEKEENRLKESVKTAQNQVKTDPIRPKTMVRHIIITNTRLCELIDRERKRVEEKLGMSNANTISYTLRDAKMPGLLSNKHSTYSKLKEEPIEINVAFNRYSEQENEPLCGEKWRTEQRDEQKSEREIYLYNNDKSDI